MKRVVSLVLACLLLAGLVPVRGFAQSDEELHAQLCQACQGTEPGALSLDAAAVLTMPGVSTLAEGENVREEMEPNNSMDLADRLLFDQTAYGKLSPYDLLDYYCFSVSEPSTVTAVCASNRISVAFSILDTDKNIVAPSSTLGYASGYFTDGVEKILLPGTYYAVVMDMNKGDASYSLYLNATPADVHICLHQVTVVPPTCVSDGYSQYVCECGDTYTADPVYATGLHTFADDLDPDCDVCGYTRELREARPVVHMYRMYDPNSGEHFYTGSELERDNLIAAGWNYEGIGFTFPLTTGDPVYRLYDPVTGEHLYTMDAIERDDLLEDGWNYEGIAFNSGFADEVPQYRLHNPNATRGAYHFTSSLEERDHLISLGWEYQGIGWYSCWK